MLKQRRPNDDLIPEENRRNCSSRISWWLYDAAPDYEVWTDDEKTKWCLKEPEALYDFIRDECQG